MILCWSTQEFELHPAGEKNLHEVGVDGEQTSDALQKNCGPGWVGLDYRHCCMLNISNAAANFLCLFS